MALATRPRPKVQHRKRQAQHHHQGKSYLKTYWPYLPMFGIVALGAVANKALYGSKTLSSNVATAVGGQHYLGVSSSSRIQNLFGSQSQWVYITALSITALAFAYFIVSHWYRIQKLFNRGEAFMLQSPWFEVATVFVFTAGYVLTRGASLPH